MPAVLYEGPIYRLPIDARAVAEATDILEITAGADYSLVLRQLILTQDLQETAEILPFQLHRTTTAGTGGAAGVANPVNPNFPAFPGTVTIDNTTRGTEGVILHRESVNIADGFYFEPIREIEMIVIPPSGRLVAGIETAPAASITVSGVAIVQVISQATGVPRRAQY